MPPFTSAPAHRNCFSYYITPGLFRIEKNDLFAEKQGLPTQTNMFSVVFYLIFMFLH